MITDLDRLHYIVNHKAFFELVGAPRGAGRTFASCHNLAGILMTCEENAQILWPLPQMRWIDHIRPMVSDILEEYGLTFHWQRYKLSVNHTKVVFFVIDCEKSYAGREHFYIVDTFGETREYREKSYSRTELTKEEIRYKATLHGENK